MDQRENQPGVEPKYQEFMNSPAGIIFTGNNSV
jgi:hypothetical protein